MIHGRQVNDHFQELYDKHNNDYKESSEKFNEPDD